MGNHYLTLDLEICLVFNLISVVVNGKISSLYTFPCYLCTFFLWGISKVWMDHWRLYRTRTLQGQRSEQEDPKMTQSSNSELPGCWARSPYSHWQGLHPKSASTGTNDPTSACSLPPTGGISNFPWFWRYPDAGQVTSQDNPTNSCYFKIQSTCCQACLIIPPLRKMLPQAFPEKGRVAGEDSIWNLNPQWEASRYRGPAV